MDQCNYDQIEELNRNHTTIQHPHLANTLQYFFVSQCGIHTRVIPFPIERHLITMACFHVSVKGVVTDVGFATLEPLSETKT